MTRLSVSLLGSFDIQLDGQSVAHLATGKARALLAYLAVEADRRTVCIVHVLECLLAGVDGV